MRWFFENFAAGVFRFLVAWILWNWVWLLSIATAAGVVALGWVNRYGYLYTAAVATAVFVVVLWAGIGLIWINNQRAQYDWTLAYQGLTLGLDTGNDDATLQISVSLVNVGPSAIKYEVREFRVIVDDRTISAPKFDNQGGIIPRSTSRSYRFPSFKKSSVENLLGKRVQGIVEYVIDYGPPNSSPVRQLKMKLSVWLRLDGSPGIADTILSEDETSL